MTRARLAALGCQSVVAPGGDKSAGRHAVSDTEWVVYHSKQVLSVQVHVKGHGRVDNLPAAQLQALGLEPDVLSLVESFAQNYPSTAPPEDMRAGSRQLSTWSAFQKAHKGQGLSRDEMSRKYHQSSSSSSSSSSSDHLKKDGAPDRRYRDNKAAAASCPSPPPPPPRTSRRTGLRTADSRRAREVARPAALARAAAASQPRRRPRGATGRPTCASG
jgi:hypothetical protein